VSLANEFKDIDISNDDKGLETLIAKAEGLGFVVFDHHRTVLELSDNLADLVGVPNTLDLVGMKADEILSELKFRDVEERKSFSPNVLTRLITQSFELAEAHRTTLLATTKDGRRIRINSWYTGDGQMLASIRDVSDYRRHRDLLEMAMEAANAGFWSMSFETGKFTYSDSVLNRLSPSEVTKMQDHGLWSIIHKSDLPEMTKTWQGIITGTAPFDLTYRVVTELDGIMWQRSVGKIERGSDGHLVGATAFVTDITKDIEKQKELLAAKEGSKAKSEFLARMSHEIRTPLNAIIGMSDSLRDENLPEEIMEVIDDIEQAADGLHHLLSRTLDHAKLISNKMQVDLHHTDIQEVVDRCFRLWRPQASVKSVALNIHVDPSIPNDLLLDSFRLQQCLNNLLSNAVKFTSKGRIDLIVKQALIKGQNSTVIAVKDTGIGMSSEDMKSIFDPFSQADGTISRTYGGTGLGMSITKQLTELMGGELRVKSETNIGSTFIIVLPVIDIAAELEKIRDDQPVQQVPSQSKMSSKTMDKEEVIEQEKSDTPNPEKPFEGLSVLCVEDNEVNQKVVRRLIGRRVKSLHFANNGQEALGVLNTLHVDVVLMDIHMPVMDGIEATLEIRSSNEPWANVIIIALTADPDYQKKRICKNIGMDDTIAKPVKREDILKAFDRTLGTVNSEYSQKIKLTA